jgi:hypothetical protein
MFEINLFLGFPVDALYELQLAQANPNIVALFVQKTNDEYLREIFHNEIRFLGKNIGKMTSLTQLELLENNIYSLLKKLVADFPYDEIPLYLFPVEQQAS